MTGTGTAANVAPAYANGAQAASTTWTVVRSPNVTLSGGSIHSVSCSAPKACTAVGTNLNTSGVFVTLAERWDGTSWQRQTTPNPPGNTNQSIAPDLFGVSCPAAGFCAAVGYYQSPVGQVSIAQTWNGSAWTMQPFPVPADSSGAELTGVSCTSPTFCEAVGGYFDNTVGDNVTLAATWDGTSWSLQTTPNPGGFNFEQFNAVSCASPTFCDAWASGNGGNPGVTIAEQWNGSSWQMQTVPSNAMVNSVSCTSATFCEAVGFGPAYEWDGSAWTSQTIPAPAGTGGLGGVSCTSRAFCEAVGENNISGNVVGVAAMWNGSAWSAQATSDPAKSTFLQLTGVSCASPSSCEAGGYFEVQLGGNDPKALAEAWDGKAWQLQHAVAPPGAVSNSLSSISCVSASFCEAAGTRFDSSGNQVGLIEMWDGQSWHIQPSPQDAESVSCVSAQFCEAVVAGPSAEIWNGTSWQVQTRPGAGDVTPQVVSCATVNFCMSADGFDQVDTWNGSAWSTGTAVPGFSIITAISCLSASFCEVLGEGPSGQDAAAWNGTSWTAQTTPAPTASSVSCTAPTSCEAVGEVPDQSGKETTLAESWNGSTWTIQPTPNPTASQGSGLGTVSCTSANSCTAVGGYSSSNVTNFGVGLTLAEVWDGTTWSLRSTPNPSPAGDGLIGVSCGASQICMAVGAKQDTGGINATLTETGD